MREIRPGPLPDPRWAPRLRAQNRGRRQNCGARRMRGRGCDRRPGRAISTTGLARGEGGFNRGMVRNFVIVRPVHDAADPRGACHPARGFGSNLSEKFSRVATAINRLRITCDFRGTWTNEPGVPSAASRIGVFVLRGSRPGARAPTPQCLAALKTEGLAPRWSPVGAIRASVRPLARKEAPP